MRSPETTGALTPAPARGTFQRTFSVADHLVGRLLSWDTPVPAGPRQPGQSAPSARAAKQSDADKIYKRVIVFSPVGLTPRGLSTRIHAELLPPFFRRLVP